jgi:hypothetical protein
MKQRSSMGEVFMIAQVNSTLRKSEQKTLLLNSSTFQLEILKQDKEDWMSEPENSNLHLNVPSKVASSTRSSSISLLR